MDILLRPPSASSPISLPEAERLFFRKAFSWMFVGLTMAALVAYVIGQDPGNVAYLFEHRPLLWIIIGAQVVIGLGAQFLMHRVSSAVGVLLFLLYAALNGITLTIPMAFHDGWSVTLAFGLTAAVFGVCAVVGYTSKWNLLTSRFRLFLLMAFVGLALVGVVSLFVHTTMMQLGLSYAVILFSSVMVVYEMQLLRQISASTAGDREMTERMGIFGALLLFGSFISILYSILNIMRLSRD